jgi:hypothetical protein
MRRPAAPRRLHQSSRWTIDSQPPEASLIGSCWRSWSSILWSATIRSSMLMDVSYSMQIKYFILYDLVSEVSMQFLSTVSFLLPFIFIEVMLGAILYGETLCTLPTRIHAALSSATSRKETMDSVIEFMIQKRGRILFCFLAATALYLAYLYAMTGNAPDVICQ